MGGKFQGRPKLIADAVEQVAEDVKQPTKPVAAAPEPAAAPAPATAAAKPLVLVTGASGFIGQRLVDALLSLYRVRALVLPNEDFDRSDVEVVNGDVRDMPAVQRACEGVEIVFHLAARVGDWGEESDYWTVNVDGSRNVLEAAVRAGCRRFVMVSSIAVYGWQLHSTTCDEEVPRAEGVGPYSSSKSASEALARDYQRRGALEVVVVRPGNVYGPGVTPWVHEIVKVLRRGQAPLIDGGSGDAHLAFVDNVVDILIAAAQHPDAPGRTYNAVDGHEITWRQYFSDLAKLAGVKPPRISVPHRVAWTAARALERFAKLRKSVERPLLTREAVVLLSSRQPIPNQRAVVELGYTPRSYELCLGLVEDYLREQNL